MSERIFSLVNIYFLNLGKKTGWRKYERKYKPEWEEQFTWVERSPDQTEMAFCIMCRDVLEPRYNGLVKHEATVKHKARERGEPMPPGQLAATEAFLGMYYFVIFFFKLEVFQKIPLIYKK
jgi:hypothetical protein